MTDDEKRRRNEGREVFEFECPDCGVHIIGEVSRCPRCGVEFLIEEVHEFECPLCGAAVPVEADACPSCGTTFGETAEAPVEEAPVDEATPTVDEEAENRRKEFPRLVEEVGPRITLAREHGLDTSEARRLIDAAVRAGREKDLVKAISSVKECMLEIDKVLTRRTESDLERLEQLVGVARDMKVDPSEVEGMMTMIREKMKGGDLMGAVQDGREAIKRAEALTGKYADSQQMVASLEKVIQDAERFYVDTRNARALLAEAKEAGDRGDWSMMGVLARKGLKELLMTLPGVVRGELTDAKGNLLEAKAAGKEIQPLVRLLKNAGIAYRQRRYEEALDILVEFKAELRRL